MAKDAGLLKDTNPALQSKIVEIWEEVEQHNPAFVVHLCSNLTEGLEQQEFLRLQRILSRYSNFRCEQETQSTLSARLARIYMGIVRLTTGGS